MEKTYNITAMRPVIIAARNSGNKKLIGKDLCAAHGVSEGYLKWYENTIDNLYKATSAYCRAKNSPAQDPAMLKTLLNEVFSAWKQVLACGEKDPAVKTLRCTEHDVSNLVGFCQRFMNDYNRAFSEDETQVHKVYAINTPATFRRMVETDLGIRIAKAEVLTDADRDYLTAERVYLNKTRKATNSIDACTKKRDELSKMLKETKDERFKQYINAQIEELDKSIAGYKTNLETAEKDFATFKAAAAGNPAPAPAPAKTADKPAAKSGKAKA